MLARSTLAVALVSALLAACSSSSNSPRAVDAPPARNNDGSPVTGIISARFNPAAAVVPFPTNLLFSGTTDLTLNIPASNPANNGDPAVAMGRLDGFSTVAPWSTTFSAPVRATSVRTGQSVRVFQVTLSGPGGAVTGVTRELTPGVDYVAALAAPTTLAIVPLKPLQQLTSYMAVVTEGITDERGNDATPDQAYFLSKRTTPLCVNGQSTDSLLPTATACALEPLRVLTNFQEAAAASQGIARDSIVLSWVATTQSITPVLQAVRSITMPATAQVVPTGLTLADLNPLLPAIANVHIGVINLPYYLDAPSASNPLGPLTGFWKAAPGAYVPPFNGFPLDPTSTNITVANPFPVVQSVQTAPVLMTVPNAASGQTRPEAGWPVVIYNHGITRNRTDALAVAGALAAQGFVVVSIDQPLHGLPPGHPLNIEGTPFGPLASERTFDVDYINNDTGAPGPDGVADPSGTHTINLQSLLTSRDNLRQAAADLSVLAETMAVLDISGDGLADFDGSRIQFTGQSLGSIVGTMFLAADPRVNVGVLSVPGGGIAKLLDGSPTFGPRIRAGLAGAGLTPGTADYERFFVAAQTVIDSADPINWGGFAALGNSVLMHEVVGGGDVLPDQVIPNAVPGAPLSGTEPLIAAMGLTALTAAGPVQNPDGLRVVTRFIAGDHGSLLNPAASLPATIEMQTQAASFLASGGAAVLVNDTSVIRTQ